MRRIYLPVALLLATACGESGNDTTDRRWTLPLHQVTTTTDQLSGRVIGSQEITWQYDDRDRVIFRTSKSTDMLQVEAFVYDSLHEYLATANYSDGVQTYYGCAESASEKDSLQRQVTTRLEITNGDNPPEVHEYKYRYDSLDRETGIIVYADGELVVRQKTEYADRGRHYERVQYYEGKTFSTLRAKITYADDELKRPLSERYESTFIYDTIPSVNTIACDYDRYGRLVRREESKGDGFTIIYSDYDYRDKRLSYVMADIADRRALRVSRTEIEYKY